MNNIELPEVINYSRDLSAQVDDESKDLLKLIKGTIAEINQLEKKTVTRKQWISLKKKREFADKLLNYIHLSANASSELLKLIETMLHFYEAEISDGGRLLQSVELWKHQCELEIDGRRRFIAAASELLTDEQKVKLFHKLK